MWRALALFAVVACKSSSSGPPDDWGTADYITAGIPKLDHPWTGAEEDTAVKAIAAHPDHLPQFEGPKSGAVFAKLIDNPADDPAMPLGDRIGNHVTRYDAMNRASKLYASLRPRRETIELWGAILREASASSALFQPFLASFPTDDPSLPARRAGLVDFNKGISAMLIGGVMVASDSNMPEADRVAMLRHIEHAVPTLFAAMPPTDQDALRSGLTSLATSDSNAVRDAAVAVQHALPR